MCPVMLKKKCKLKIDIPAIVYYHILLNLETRKNIIWKNDDKVIKEQDI